MSNDLKHTIYNPTDCLSEKMLFDYIDNKLSQKERHIVEKHLLDCEMCSDALEGLEMVKDRNRIALIKEAINKKSLLLDSARSDKKGAVVVSFNYKMAFSIAATIALLIVGVFFFKNIGLKEASMGDMAELTKEESAPPPPPLSESVTEVTDSSGETRATVATSKSEEDKLGPSKVAVDEIAFAEEQKPGFYKNSEGTGESANQEIPPMVAGNATINVNDATVTPQDDRKNAPVETASSPKSAALEREKNAKLDDTKKAEEKTIGGTTGGTTYSWNTPANTSTPDQKQKNTGDNATSGKEVDLAKKADKDSGGKYRSDGKLFEQKDKAKKGQATTKENNRNEDSNNEGLASSPQSVSQDAEELKSEVATGTYTTTLADSVGQIFSIVDQMPEYPGGNDSLTKFIDANFLGGKPIDKINPITTKIYVQFIVAKDGSIVNPRIIKGATPELDKEALRVVKMMPKWKPGKQNGKAVSVSYNISMQQKIK